MVKSKPPTTDEVCQVSQVVGSNMRALRYALKLSQEELAFRAGLDRSYISQIERGIANPSILAVARISEALGVPLSELFGQDH